jgi:hypothetical protein
MRDVVRSAGQFTRKVLGVLSVLVLMACAVYVAIYATTVWGLETPAPDWVQRLAGTIMILYIIDRGGKQ